MNSLLVLRPLEKDMVVSEIQFQLCAFWVQIHGLPVEKMCRANAEIIGGRIGHDNRGCRFTPRGTEGQSGYDPELRTGRARKIVVPIEEIVSPEEESEDRAENPRSRRSELQLEDDTGVGGNGTMVERVVTSNDVLLGTDVNIPREPGTKCHNIPFSGAQGISDFVSSGFVDSLSGNGSDHLIKPTPSTTLVKPGLNVNPIINTPISPTTSPVNPTYFVTEPPDSPKNPYPNSELNPTPFSLSQPLPTPKALTSNPPKIILQPGKPTSPQNLDITLATVFKTLNLKRKPHDDLQELSSSKILRLCSPNPLTLPETAPKPPTRPNRKPSKPTRYLNSAKKGEWFPY
ncbi:hypothetical protein RHGRI_028083 [Rhododendron griersonianum]|uniref:DUF4283 domain-containing protein n=1 Tax=Rhododendron griersonianum TaxID=479676 RepID=A0AAV6IJ31_9ERIC|nr:hypothetical protein RHGRI_028083 [Rhododendron griersonianum]